MVNNPFVMLEIEPIANKAIITQTYERLRDKGGTEKYLSDLDKAYHDCLKFAETNGGIEIFTDHHIDRNQTS